MRRCRPRYRTEGLAAFKGSSDCGFSGVEFVHSPGQSSFVYHAWAWTTCIEAFVLLVAALAPFTSWRLMAQRRPKVAIVESRICPLQTRSLVDEPAGRLSPDKSPGLLEKGSSRSCASTRFGACVTPPVTRTLGHLAPHPISRGAPPWQASVVVCLGCPFTLAGHRKFQ